MKVGGGEGAETRKWIIRVVKFLKQTMQENGRIELLMRRGVITRGERMMEVGEGSRSKKGDHEKRGEVFEPRCCKKIGE